MKDNEYDTFKLNLSIGDYKDNLMDDNGRAIFGFYVIFNKGYLTDGAYRIYDNKRFKSIEDVLKFNNSCMYKNIDINNFNEEDYSKDTFGCNNSALMRIMYDHGTTYQLNINCGEKVLYYDLMSHERVNLI